MTKRARLKKYVAHTDFTEFEASRHDTYDEFARKAAFAVGLIDEEDDGVLSLFKPVAGAIIPSTDITNRDGKKVPWTLGSYLQRARKGAESVFFGVGYIPLPQVTYSFLLDKAVHFHVFSMGASLMLVTVEVRPHTAGQEVLLLKILL